MDPEGKFLKYFVHGGLYKVRNANTNDDGNLGKYTGKSMD